MRHAIIMAGGSGTRLWPMSRPHAPKQLIPFLPGNRSLLDIAIERIIPITKTPQNRWICTNQSLAQSITQSFAKHNQTPLPAENLLAEPIGRDTLNAVAFSAAIIEKLDPDASIAILTADHVITPLDKFTEYINLGFNLVESKPETLITFSIIPDRPATEYGYIERTNQIPDHPHAFTVKQYVEKPDLKTAQSYLDAKTFGWSSGMFIFKAKTILNTIKKYQPQCYEGILNIQNAWGANTQQQTLNEIYPTLPRISIDYAIMEPASRDPEIPLATIPMKLNWLDVGSWSSFAKLLNEDHNHNRTNTETTLLDCKNTIAISDNPDHHIAMIGCDNLIVIHTENATLILPANQEQNIKNLVNTMNG